MVSSEQKLKIVKETKLLVELFLKTKHSDTELAKITGISSSTVGRRLTNKERIAEAFTRNGEEIYKTVMSLRKKNLLRGKIIGGQASMLNNVYTNKEGDFIENTKLRLDIIYDDLKMQMKFLFHLALTFKAKPELLASLFQIDEKEILTQLILVSGKAYSSLLYLLYHDNTNQEVARNNIITFYKDLLNAIRKRDVVTKKDLIESITDNKVSKILKKDIDINNMTDEEIFSILNYQLKYSLDITNLVNTLKINGLTYQKRVELFIQNQPELKTKYMTLCNHGGKYA